MKILTVYDLGKDGVNVDKSDLHMQDSELRQAQNAIHDPLGTMGGIKNRPGLTKFNSVAAAGSVVGGIGVPLSNMKSGTRYLYIGWGPI